MARLIVVVLSVIVALIWSFLLCTPLFAQDSPAGLRTCFATTGGSSAEILKCYETAAMTSALQADKTIAEALALRPEDTEKMTTNQTLWIQTTIGFCNTLGDGVGEVAGDKRKIAIADCIYTSTKVRASNLLQLKNLWEFHKSELK